MEESKDRISELQDEIAKLRFELEKSKKVEKADKDSQDAFDNDATKNDSQLISLISIFLHVHSSGASIDYICSYLVKTNPALFARDVESLKTNPTLISRDVESFLKRFPGLFREVSAGIGASLEKKWKYIGFEDEN